MDTDRNEHQIIRKDARACFVESLNDSFQFGKVHFGFAAYDMKRPEGQRQTNSVHIYMAVDEFLELCRKLCSGELRYMMNQRVKEGNKEPIYKCLGGTAAEKLAKINRSRPDGMSLSRTAELVCGKNGNLRASMNCTQEPSVRRNRPLSRRCRSGTSSLTRWWISANTPRPPRRSLPPCGTFSCAVQPGLARPWARKPLPPGCTCHI